MTDILILESIGNQIFTLKPGDLPKY